MLRATIRVVILLTFCVGYGSQARATERFALAIGNDAYSYPPGREQQNNAKNDAKAVRMALKNLNVEVLHGDLLRAVPVGKPTGSVGRDPIPAIYDQVVDDPVQLAAGGGSRQSVVDEKPAAGLAQERRTRALMRNVWIDLGTRQADITRLKTLARERGLTVEESIRETWKSEGKKSDTFDCGTSLFSGFRYLYCLLRNVMTLNKVASISGVSVFLGGGPHQDDLNWSEPYSFGYYNPEFLKWVDRFLIPEGRNDSRFNQLTQAVYETYIKSLARALYHSHEILFANTQEFEKFKTRYEIAGIKYRERLERKEVNESRFDNNVNLRSIEDIKADYLKRLGERIDPENGDFLQESYRWLADYLATEKNDDWYLANTAGGFWVRRSIDGTESQVFGLLRKLMKTFEPGRE